MNCQPPLSKFEFAEEQRWVFVVPLESMVHRTRFDMISEWQVVCVQLFDLEFAVWKLIAPVLVSLLERYVLLCRA